MKLPIFTWGVTRILGGWPYMETNPNEDYMVSIPRKGAKTCASTKVQESHDITETFCESCKSVKDSLKHN